MTPWDTVFWFFVGTAVGAVVTISLLWWRLTR